MKTGVVLRKLRSVRDGKETRVVTEYEINTALIECLNSVERRAAIETGQEVDRQDINLRARAGDQADVLAKTFMFEGLRTMRAQMQAPIDAEQGKSAPPANIIELKPVLEVGEKHETTVPDAASAEGNRAELVGLRQEPAHASRQAYCWTAFVTSISAF